MLWSNWIEFLCSCRVPSISSFKDLSTDGCDRAAAVIICAYFTQLHTLCTQYYNVQNISVPFYTEVHNIREGVKKFSRNPSVKGLQIWGDPPPLYGRISQKRFWHPRNIYCFVWYFHFWCVLHIGLKPTLTSFIRQLNCWDRPSSQPNSLQKSNNSFAQLDSKYNDSWFMWCCMPWNLKQKI